MTKNLFFFGIFLFFGFSIYAQSSKVAFVENSEIIKSNLSENLIRFKIPSITQKEIDKYSQYYTNTFTVNLFADDEITLKLKENDPNKNRVVLRFLSALNVQQIKVSEKEFSLSDFYEAFLK